MFKKNIKYIMSFSVLGLLILFSFIRMSDLQAEYDIDSTLHISSFQQEETQTIVDITLSDNDATNMKVFLSIPKQAELLSHSEKNAAVIYDDAEHQIVVDWLTDDIQDRNVTITVYINETGEFPFQAYKIEETQKKVSELHAIIIPEVPQESENIGTQLPELENEIEADSSIIEEQEIIEEVVSNERVKVEQENAVGQPLSEIFKDRELLLAVSRTLNKGVDSLLTQSDIDMTKELDVGQATELSGIEVFVHLENLIIQNNRNIISLPESVGELRQLRILKIVSVPNFTYIPDSIGQLTNLKSVIIQNANIHVLPETFSNLDLTGLIIWETKIANLPQAFNQRQSLISISFEENFLPNDGKNELKAMFPKANILYNLVFPIKKLKLKTNQQSFDIHSLEELENLDLKSLVTLQPFEVEPMTLVLDEYTDLNNKPVDIENYFKKGNPREEISLLAKVRIKADGFFKSKNTNTLTNETIRLNLIPDPGFLAFESVPMDMSFGEALEISAKNEAYALEKLDAPIVIRDTRLEKTEWTLLGQLSEPFMSETGRSLPRALVYRINGIETILNEDKALIMTHKNEEEEDDFYVSNLWNNENNGLYLKIKPGEVRVGAYQAKLKWILQDVPLNR